MPVSKTSLDAHDSKSRGRQEAAVLGYIQGAGIMGYTREEIARWTGLKESSVCGRVNALIKQGLVYEAGHRFTSTGRHAAILRAVPEQQEIE